MPAGKAVPAFDRTWLALALTCQVFVGAFDAPVGFCGPVAGYSRKVDKMSLCI